MKIELVVSEWDSAALAYDHAKESESGVDSSDEDAVEVALSATSECFDIMMKIDAPNVRAVISKMRATIVEYHDHIPSDEAALVLADLERFAA